MAKNCAQSKAVRGRAEAKAVKSSAKAEQARGCGRMSK